MEDSRYPYTGIRSRTSNKCFLLSLFLSVENAVKNFGVFQSNLMVFGALVACKFFLAVVSPLISRVETSICFILNGKLSQEYQIVPGYLGNTQLSSGLGILACYPRQEAGGQVYLRGTFHSKCSLSLFVLCILLGQPTLSS